MPARRTAVQARTSRASAPIAAAAMTAAVSPVSPARKRLTDASAAHERLGREIRGQFRRNRPAAEVREHELLVAQIELIECGRRKSRGRAWGS
jgi:hypothetical protein